MTQNKLTDLNNHLFAQLERLSDEELSQEALKKEMERAKAINGIARNIIDNAKVALEGAQYAYSHLKKGESIPEQFEVKKLSE